MRPSTLTLALALASCAAPALDRPAPSPWLVISPYDAAFPDTGSDDDEDETPIAPIPLDLRPC